MSQDLFALVRRSMDAWNRGDVDEFVAVTHPDMVWRPASTSALSGTDDAYRGHDGVHRWWDEMHAAFEGLNNELHEIRPVTADAVLVIVTGRGRGRSAGVPVEWKFSMLLESQEGLFVRGRSWFDVEEGVRAAEALAQSHDPS